MGFQVRRHVSPSADWHSPMSPSRWRNCGVASEVTFRGIVLKKTQFVAVVKRGANLAETPRRMRDTRRNNGVSVSKFTPRQDQCVEDSSTQSCTLAGPSARALRCLLNHEPKTVVGAMGNVPVPRKTRSAMDPEYPHGIPCVPSYARRRAWTSPAVQKGIPAAPHPKYPSRVAPRAPSALGHSDFSGGVIPGDVPRDSPPPGKSAASRPGPYDDRVRKQHSASKSRGRFQSDINRNVYWEAVHRRGSSQAHKQI